MRLTLDWDGEPPVTESGKSMMDIIRLRYREHPWELRKSSSGNGWHVVVYGAANDTPGGFSDITTGANALREQYGDDPKRLRLDRHRWNLGSPFEQVLYRRKYMDRDEWPDADGTGYSTGHAAQVVEQSEAVKAAPERERIKMDNGKLRYHKIARLLVGRYGSRAELADKMDVSTSTIGRWVREDTGISTRNQKGLRRKARSQGIGHYAEDNSGGHAVDEVRWIDPEDERRLLVEYVDVPMDWDIGGDDREYGLLNVHTGTYNDNISDRQLRHVHDDIAESVLAVLSPTNPKTGQHLNLNDENSHFIGVSGWEREADSVNYERELLDDGEAQVYLDNLPGQAKLNGKEPRKHILFEVILWNEDMTDTEWHVIGMWDGESVSDATILTDRGLGRWASA